MNVRPELNLPSFDFRIYTENSVEKIWDDFRRKNIVLTPEEWVRQNFLRYLTEHLGYPKSLVKVESGVKYNRMSKRHDALVYNSAGDPWILVECKSTDIPLNRSAFEQIAVYNKTIESRYIVLTNGLLHFCCKQDFKSGQIDFLKEIPPCSF